MKAYLKIILSMLIWGTLPVFVKGITSITSVEIVFCRIVIAIVSLFIIFLFAKTKPNLKNLKKNLLRMLLTGVIMGLNWVCLFESYRFIDAGTATLLYYLAPVFVVIFSIVLLKEKLSFSRLLSIICAVAGMIIITGKIGGVSLKGAVLGLLSAVLYAGVTISNKFYRDLDGITVTLGQLVGAFCAICPYALIAHEGAFPEVSAKETVFLLVLGIVHSGLALWLYFSSLPELPAQSAAVLSYVDPASSIVFATLILKEELTLAKVIGAILIIGGAIFGEVFATKKKRDI